MIEANNNITFYQQRANAGSVIFRLKTLHARVTHMQMHFNLFGIHMYMD